MSVNNRWQERARLSAAGGVGLVLVVFGGVACTAAPPGGRSGPVAVSSALTSTVTSSSVPVTTAVETPAGVVVPAGVVGRTAREVRAELAALGFRDVVVEAEDGAGAVSEATWRVVSVTSAGAAVPLTTRLVLKVAKPAPATSERPPPTSRKADPPPVRETQPAPVHYKNCTDAKNRGAAPVRRGDPGYGKHLDRDGDGIGCEK